MQTGIGAETNSVFAQTNQRFRDACARVYDDDGKTIWAGVSPTPRQASKYRNKKGAAYKHAKGLS